MTLPSVIASTEPTPPVAQATPAPQPLKSQTGFEGTLPRIRSPWLNAASCLAQLNIDLQAGGRFWRALDCIGEKVRNGQALTVEESNLFEFFIHQPIDRRNAIRDCGNRVAAIVAAQECYVVANERGDADAAEFARKNLQQLAPCWAHIDRRHPVVQEAIDLAKELADKRSRRAYLASLAFLPSKRGGAETVDGRRILNSHDASDSPWSTTLPPVGRPASCVSDHVPIGRILRRTTVRPAAWIELSTAMQAEIKTLDAMLPGLEQQVAAQAEADRLVAEAADAYLPAD